MSSFNLGAFGIRPGTERITVDDRLLVRGVDYVLDYDIGLVTLLDPQATLGGNPDAEIRATWEQQSMFEIAPTTVVGLHARSRWASTVTSTWWGSTSRSRPWSGGPSSGWRRGR
jgi:cell surface protein SprA